MQKNSRLLIIVTMLLEALVILLISEYIFYCRDVDDLKAILPFASLISVVISGLMLFSIKGLEEHVKKVMESNLLKTHLLQVEELLNTLRTQKHEHRRHVQTVQAMLYLGETDKAAEYMEGIAEGCRDTETETVVCVGHPALTALLNSKRKVAEAKKIDFVFAVKCDIAGIDVHPWDLCSILGNLMDNAFEAVLHNRVHRRVAIEIKYEDVNYVLYVYNNGPQIPAKDRQQLFTPGYTTKESVARGYGLYLVKKLVHRYGGKIDVLSGERTTFVVYLPERSRGIGGQITCSENGNIHGSTVAG